MAVRTGRDLSNFPRAYSYFFSYLCDRIRQRGFKPTFTKKSQFISKAWHEYQETPLHELSDYARMLFLFCTGLHASNRIAHEQKKSELEALLAPLRRQVQHAQSTANDIELNHGQLRENENLQAGCHDEADNKNENTQDDSNSVSSCGSDVHDCPSFAGSTATHAPANRSSSSVEEMMNIFLEDSPSAQFPMQETDCFDDASVFSWLGNDENEAAEVSDGLGIREVCHLDDNDRNDSLEGFQPNLQDNRNGNDRRGSETSARAPTGVDTDVGSLDANLDLHFGD